MEPMYGDLVIGNQLIARAGFMHPGLGPLGMQPGPETPALARGLSAEANATIERMQAMAGIERADMTLDMRQMLAGMANVIAEQQRAITTANANTSWIPIRENLEAPARLLVPTETPVRNMLPRVMGSGLATAWRQIISMGGGYGYPTTVTSGVASATQTVASTAGIQPGDILQFVTATTGVIIGVRTVLSITSPTVLVLTATVTTVTGDYVYDTTRPYGAGTPTGIMLGATPTYTARSFYAESGAPPDKGTTYAARSEAYKLLGTLGSVTGFAAAAGDSYQDQMGIERTNALQNLFLNEENALINGSKTSILAPWGDGTTALGFDGLLNQITTANGTPADQIQTAVGPLTLSFVDGMLKRITEMGGGRGQWLLCNAQEMLSLTHLLEASGSIVRVPATASGRAVLGAYVESYIHPLTGEPVPIYWSRFLTPGTMIFGSKFLPDGSPAADVSVLPQVPLPPLSADQQIQGYTFRYIAPTVAAIDVFAFAITLYETLRVKAGTVFGKASGVTAV
jgi:hypothetical protein